MVDGMAHPQTRSFSLCFSLCFCLCLSPSLWRFLTLSPPSPPVYPLSLRFANLDTDGRTDTEGRASVAGRRRVILRSLRFGLTFVSSVTSMLQNTQENKQTHPTGKAVKELVLAAAATMMVMKMMIMMKIMMFQAVNMGITQADVSSYSPTIAMT